MNKKAVIEYVDYGRAIGVLLDLARDYGDMDECTEETIKMCIRALNRLPTLTPESLVKRGRWIDNHCSVCGMMPMGDDLWRFLVDIDPPKFEYFMRFCPTCGAKMVED